MDFGCNLLKFCQVFFHNQFENKNLPKLETRCLKTFIKNVKKFLSLSTLIRRPYDRRFGQSKFDMIQTFLRPPMNFKIVPAGIKLSNRRPDRNGLPLGSRKSNFAHRDTKLRYLVLLHLRTTTLKACGNLSVVRDLIIQIMSCN